MDDNLFQKVSGIVTSQTVLAHLRKATIGSLNTINTHPFQFGHWVFAHNGNIKDFKKHHATLLERIAPKLKRFILGDTDSELIFYLNHTCGMIRDSVKRLARRNWCTTKKLEGLQDHLDIYQSYHNQVLV